MILVPLSGNYVHIHPLKAPLPFPKNGRNTSGPKNMVEETHKSKRDCICSQNQNIIKKQN